MLRTILLSLFTSLVISANAQQANNTIANFVATHPNKSSVYIRHNGKVVADINSNDLKQLASTVKIIVAIEYAAQAATGKIDPHMMVDTADVHRYYIPNTDGGAQVGWLQQMQAENRFVDGKVSVEELAKGMINFSSNANTEYLIDLLGLENINRRLTLLGLTKHQPLYYFTSAIYLIDDKSKEDVEAIPMSEYIAQSSAIHFKLKNDSTFHPQVTNLRLDAQKAWSDRLPASTTKEYVSILQKVNERNYFDSATQANIDIVLGGIMSRPNSKKWLKHGGFKGGSTMFVLTQAIYLTTINDETLEIAYFFNDLTPVEFSELREGMQEFEAGLIFNKDGARDNILNLMNKN